MEPLETSVYVHSSLCWLWGSHPRTWFQHQGQAVLLLERVMRFNLFVGLAFMLADAATLDLSTCRIYSRSSKSAINPSFTIESVKI